MLLATKQTVTLVIRRRTLTIGGQTYPLHNIARVQNLELKPDRPRIVRRLLKRALPWIGLLVFVDLMVGTRNRVGGPVAVLNVLALSALAIMAMVDILRLNRASRYVLLLETTGTPFTVLYSKRQEAVQQVVDRIADALENPPTEPTFQNFGDVVMGDKLKQVGDRNIGKIVDG